MVESKNSNSNYINPYDKIIRRKSICSAQINKDVENTSVNPSTNHTSSSTENASNATPPHARTVKENIPSTYQNQSRSNKSSTKIPRILYFEINGIKYLQTSQRLYRLEKASEEQTIKFFEDRAKQFKTSSIKNIIRSLFK